MEVYVVHQLGYTGTNQLEILGVFRNIREAKQCYEKNIEENIKEFDFDYDKECNHLSLNDTHYLKVVIKKTGIIT